LQHLDMKFAMPASDKKKKGRCLEPNASH